MVKTLVLGVVDIPYVQSPEPLKPRKDGRPAKPKKLKSGEQTTGMIAEILEDKYQIMQRFFDMHKANIAEDLTEAMAGSLESLLMGAPPRADLFASGTSKIEQQFRSFLENKEMDKLGIAGVPTAAALAGISHRFKGKFGPERPSFIDTGLYASAMKSWIK